LLSSIGEIFVANSGAAPENKLTLKIAEVVLLEYPPSYQKQVRKSNYLAMIVTKFRVFNHHSTFISTLEFYSTSEWAVWSLVPRS
jgi:hypothetical protein